MRITNSILYNTVKRSIQKAAQDLHDKQEKLSSGKKVLRPSDDPLSAMRAQQLHTSLNKTGQYQRNNTYAKSWLQTTEAALHQSSDLLIRLKELAVSQSSDQYNAEIRQGAAQEVESLRDQLLALANTKAGKRSVFAGHATDSPAFSPAGQYAGSEGEIYLNIDEGMTLKLNVTGDEVFESAEGKTIFQSLDDFVTALESNDTEGIRDVMEELETTFTRVNSSLSLMGSRANTLEKTRSINEEQTIIDTDQLGNVEEIDMIQTVVDMQSAQNAFQASLLASGQIGKLNLGQFI